MKNPAASQAIVASSVFLELVDFSKLPMSVQVQTKNHFNATLRLGLSELGENNYWLRDQGDGTLIVCQNSPEHALFLALNVYNAFISLALPLRAPLKIASFFQAGLFCREIKWAILTNFSDP